MLDFTPFEFKCFPSRFFYHLFSTRHPSLCPGSIYYLASLFLIVYQLQRALLIRGLLELWMLSDSELLKEFGNYLLLFNTHSAKITNATYRPWPAKEDAQRIHGVCSTAKGILRLLMQAASLPRSVLCNPGKDFLNFTNFSINAEKPQERRISPFRKHLIQN